MVRVISTSRRRNASCSSGDMVRMTASASSEEATSNSGFSSLACSEARRRSRMASCGASATCSSSRACIAVSTLSTMAKKSASLDG